MKIEKLVTKNGSRRRNVDLFAINQFLIFYALSLKTISVKSEARFSKCFGSR